MEIKDLAPEERLCMIGLMKAVIQADKLYSKEESTALKKIAGMVGEEIFNDTVSVARDRFITLTDIKDFAGTMDRPEARKAIYDLLEGLAGADTMVDQEAELLCWLKEKWDI